MTLKDFKRAFITIEGPSTNDRGAQVFRGYSRANDVLGFSRCVPQGFREVEEWQDGRFRAVWVDDEIRHTITYCEGDIILVSCETQEIYDAEIAHAAAFYADH